MPPMGACPSRSTVVINSERKTWGATDGKSNDILETANRQGRKTAYRQKTTACSGNTEGRRPIYGRFSGRNPAAAALFPGSPYFYDARGGGFSGIRRRIAHRPPARRWAPRRCASVLRGTSVSPPARYRRKLLEFNCAAAMSPLSVHGIRAE